MQYGADRGKNGRPPPSRKRRGQSVRLVVLTRNYWMTLEQAEVLLGELRVAVTAVERERIATRPTTPHTELI